MKQKLNNSKGISLIALIITIIVIIILVAIVITRSGEMVDNANFARFVSEFDDYDTAVQQDFSKRYTKYQIAGKHITNAQIYYMIASGTEIGEYIEPTETGKVADLGLSSVLNGTEYYEITSDTNIYGWSKQKSFYDKTEKHYVTDMGEVFILPGYGLKKENTWYINSKKHYTSSTGISANSNMGSSGGNEEPAGEPISKTDSYVGYFADTNGDGNIDGIIYADLLAQRGESNQWGTVNGVYTIPTGVTTSNVREYVISEDEKTVSSFNNITKGVISPASGGGTQERFYVMSLQDFTSGSNSAFTWYKTGYGHLPADPSVLTLNDFGSGADNTSTLKTTCNAGTYGAQDDGDIWQYIPSGWFIPSREEWGAFAIAFSITNNNRSNFGLSDIYWSSSECNAYAAWVARFDYGQMNILAPNTTNAVRLSKTF